MNANELRESIKKAIEELKNCNVQVDESTFEIDADDQNMQQKISKIKDDSTLFNKDTDEITIKNESKYSKSEFAKMVQEARTCKSEGKTKPKSKNDDQMKAIKKADREMGYEINGEGWQAGDKAHKNQKKYDRKSFTKGDIIEMFKKSK